MVQGITALSLRPILLVEDNHYDAELTIEALKRGGVANELVWVIDGETALDRLYGIGAFDGEEVEQPCLILLDVRLPRLDGIELLKLLKSNERFASIPVVMLTGSREQSDVIRAYQLGTNAYVVKPMSAADFRAAVRDVGIFWALLNQAPPTPERPAARRRLLAKPLILRR